MQRFILVRPKLWLFRSILTQHLAEEVRDASSVLPKCMVWGYLYNAVLGLVMLITMLFTVGNLDDAINAASPFQNAFTNTGSQGLNTFLTLFLFLLILSGNITAVTTVSRETWAFARDGGLPFSRWMSKVSFFCWKRALGTRLLTYPQQVSRRYNSPLNAVYVTTFLSLVLCLVNLGSNVAFNIIISLNLVAFLVTYLLSIGCILWKRLQHEPLPPAKFSLGRWGVPINIFAVLYSTLAIVLSCFPVSLPVDAVNANWAPAIMAAVLVIALVSYMLQGRKIYEGPVVYVEGRRKANAGLQSVETT